MLNLIGFDLVGNLMMRSLMRRGGMGFVGNIGENLMMMMILGLRREGKGRQGR